VVIEKSSGNFIIKNIPKRSLGVIAYILLSGQSPFLGETMAHTYCNVEQARWMFCEEFAENAISEQAKDFISRLLILQKE
jgi:serine/threonine protein kinase